MARAVARIGLQRDNWLIKSTRLLVIVEVYTIAAEVAHAHKFTVGRVERLVRKRLLLAVLARTNRIVRQRGGR